MTFSSHLAHKLAVLPCRRRLALQELLARNGCLGKKDDFKEDGDGDGEDILLKKIVWLLAHDNDEQRQTNTSRNINNNNVNVLWLESVKRVLCLIDGELWVEMLMLLELDGGLGGGGGGGGEFGGANAADTLETPTCTSPTPTPTPTPTPSPSPNTPSSASCSFSFEFGSGGGCGQAAADLDLEAASVSLAETDRPSSPSIRLASPALCIAMRDRPAEMHETIRKNINFFNHLRLDHFNPCSSSSSTWLDFKSLLLTSRDLLNDYEWMEQVKLYFSDSADLEHFKLLVGYNEEVCERIGKSTSYNGKRSGDHSFPSPNLGSTPPSASLQHHRHLSRRHRTPFQYSSRRQITVAERRHLDINALETHAPLFFNLAKAHLLMSESPSSPSSEEVEKEESSYPGIQYQRFIDFLQIDVQDLDDGRWVSFMTHRYFKSSRILRRMFRSVIASINTEDGEIIDSDDEEWTDEWVVEMREKTTLFEMTVYQHSEFFDMLKTACLELGIECDDGEGGENGDAGRKKYPLQVKHQHQQNHNLYPLPPPQSFQEFMDILHTPREQMDDSTWMQLVTDFVGGRVDQRRHHFHFLGRFMELFGCRLIPSHFTACVSIPGGGIDGATGGCIVGGGRGGGGRINDKEKAKEEVEVDGYHVWEAEDDEDWLPFSTDLGSGDEHKNTTTLAASSISDAATNTTTETPDYDYCSCCSKGDLVQEALMKAGLLERLRLTVRQHFINPDKTKMKEKKKHQHQLLSQEHEKVE